MTTRRLFAMLGALVLAGCSNSTGLPAALNGTWENQGVGLRYAMTLTTAGNAVSGTGDWFGEACCSGTLAVTGIVNAAAVNAAAVTLDMNFTATAGGPTRPAPFTQHFEGHFVRPDSLAGVLRSGDQVFPYGYRRSP